MNNQRSNCDAFRVVRLGARSTARALRGCLQASSRLDWSRVAQQAWFHRVHPLLHHTLQQLDLAALPSATKGWFEETSQAAAVWNRFGLDELNTVLQVLEQSAVPALVFKGPMLSHVAYGDAGLRHSVDLDVLVRGRDVATVDALLLDQGYRRLNPDASPLRRRIRFLFQHEHHYARGELVYNLDIHATAVKPSLGYRIPFETLHARAQEIQIGDRSFLTPSVEDMLQLLCYHGAKDRWVRLRRICDINELVRRHPDLEWEAVLTRARVARGERIVALGLHLAHTVLDLPLPESVRRFMDQHPSMIAWGNRLAARLPRRVDEMAWGSLRERVAYPLAIQDTLAGKVRYAAYAGMGKLVSRIA